ncbi:PrsW family intramembrane metalloprotease [Thermodesulfobacteriota bacterium]
MSCAHNVARVFLAGCLCTMPVLLVEHLTDATLVQDDLLAAARVSFLLIAPAEELLKLVAVWVSIYRRPEFREPIDGIFYAATAGLGFACVENVLFMSVLGPNIVVARILYATPAHVLFAAMWGYSMGIARFRRDKEMWIIAQGLILAILFHGSYDFLVALRPKAAMLSLIPLMIFMALVLNYKIRQFRKESPFKPLGKGALICCPMCGAYTPESKESCERCGVTIEDIEPDAPRYCSRCRARLSPLRESCGGCGEPVAMSTLCIGAS